MLKSRKLIKFFLNTRIFLTSNIGIFDSQSFNQHSEAWKKAQQNGKAKAKKTTTGTAGVIGGKKPQPVTKNPKDKGTTKASKKKQTILKK